MPRTGKRNRSDDEVESWTIAVGRPTAKLQGMNEESEDLSIMRNRELHSLRFAIHLHGRGDELDWLEREINDRDRFRPDAPIIVVGEAGIGKTALVDDFLAHASRIPPLWVNCPDWKDENPDYDYAIQTRDIAGRERRGVSLVLDGADALTDERIVELYHRAQNFKLIRAIVITSRRNLALFPGQRILSLKGLLQSDAQRWIQQISNKGALDDASMARLLDLAGGHPLTLVQLSLLARSMPIEGLRQVLNGKLYDIRDLSEARRRDLVTLAEPLIITANQSIIDNLRKHPKDIYALSPRQYEELVAELLKDMGYDVELTPATRDGGKDILAFAQTPAAKLLCLVEAKRYRMDRTVGVELVRGLYGTLHDYKANSAMMVTTSHFSPDAIAFEQRHQFQLSLKDYGDIASWIQKYRGNA